jgi:hypothetical protein
MKQFKYVPVPLDWRKVKNKRTQISTVVKKRHGFYLWNHGLCQAIECKDHLTCEYYIAEFAFSEN